MKEANNGKNKLIFNNLMSNKNIKIRKKAN